MLAFGLILLLIVAAFIGFVVYTLLDQTAGLPMELGSLELSMTPLQLFAAGAAALALLALALWLVQVGARRRAARAREMRDLRARAAQTERADHTAQPERVIRADETSPLPATEARRPATNDTVAAPTRRDVIDNDDPEYIPGSFGRD